MTMFLAGIASTFVFSALVFLLLVWRAPAMNADGSYVRRPVSSRVHEPRRRHRSTVAHA